MPAYLDTGLNIIDVEDCARGHILAAEKGVVGEKYILGNENLTLKSILETLGEITGKKAPKIRLPHTPILLAAYISELISAVTNKEPLIPVAGVKMANKFMFFDSTKAVKELGLPQRPARKSLERAVEWFKLNEYVK